VADSERIVYGIEVIDNRPPDSVDIPRSTLSSSSLDEAVRSSLTYLRDYHGLKAIRPTLTFIPMSLTSHQVKTLLDSLSGNQRSLGKTRAIISSTELLLDKSRGNSKALFLVKSENTTARTELTTDSSHPTNFTLRMRSAAIPKFIHDYMCEIYIANACNPALSLAKAKSISELYRAKAKFYASKLSRELQPAQLRNAVKNNEYACFTHSLRQGQEFSSPEHLGDTCSAWDNFIIELLHEFPDPDYLRKTFISWPKVGKSLNIRSLLRETDDLSPGAYLLVTAKKSPEHNVAEAERLKIRTLIGDGHHKSGKLKSASAIYPTSLPVEKAELLRWAIASGFVQIFRFWKA
jgi:hypothetical protein